MASFLQKEKPEDAVADYNKMLSSMGEAHECGTDTVKIQFYSDQADSYDNDMAQYDYNGPRYSAVTVHKYLDGNDEAEILDIGAGSGLVTKELRKLGSYPNIDAIDPATELLNRGKKLGRFRKTWNEYFYEDCRVLPYESYDVVVTSGTFGRNHLPASSINEMAKIVKKGGLLVIAIRARYLLPEGELSEIPKIFEKLETESVMERYEWSVLPKYFGDDPGKVICYRKL